MRRRLQAATRFIGGFLNNCLPRVSGVHTGRRSGLDSPHQGTTSERIGLEIKPTAEAPQAVQDEVVRMDASQLPARLAGDGSRLI